MGVVIFEHSDRQWKELLQAYSSVLLIDHSIIRLLLVESTRVATMWALVLFRHLDA